MARDEIAAYNDELRHLEQNIINLIITSGSSHVQETANLPTLGSALTRRWILQYMLRILPMMYQDINDLGGDSYFDSFTDDECIAMLESWIRGDLDDLRSNGGLVPEWSDQGNMGVLHRAILDEIRNILRNLDDDPPVESRVLSISEEAVLKCMHVRRCGVSDVGIRVDDDAVCVVCQDMLYQKHETIATLRCGHEHEYHFECIKPWLQGNSICPLCRVQLLKTNIN